MSTPRLVVVGGGLAGLAAAIDAADAGVAVNLVERAPRLGGATWSFTHEGISYDNGQHVFMRCCTEYRRFLERIGSADKVTLQERMDVPVLRPGGPSGRLRRVSLPAPLHLGPALAGYRQLSFADRLRAVRTALALRRLDPADDRLDGSSFGEWLARHGASAPATEALWNLVCLPTVNLPAGEASLQLAAKVFRTGMLDTPGGGDLGWSRVPLSDLHAGPAAAALARKGAVISTGVRATEVRSTGDRPSVVAAGEAVEADAVIVAVPHHEVGALLPPASFDGQEHVAELGRSPIVNVHLVYDRRVVEEPLTAAIGSPVQFVFDRTKASGVAGNRQCLAISLSAADEYLGWSPRALVERFTAEMARVFPRAAGAQVVTSMVTREVAATFRGAPGSGRLRPGPSTDLRGVFLAGAWTDTGWPATMEGAVRSGRAAASAAIEHLRTHRPERQGAAV